MADENTPNANEITFDADPALDGPAAINFEADPADADETIEPPRSSTTDKLRSEASRLGGQAADKARAFAGEGKERASSALDQVANMMEKAAIDVDEKLGADYGRYARSAAQGVSGFAESLRGREVDDLIDDAAAFVKKSPMVAVGVAAGIGFVLARLIKSGIDAAADLADRDTTVETQTPADTPTDQA